MAPFMPQNQPAQYSVAQSESFGTDQQSSCDLPKIMENTLHHTSGAEFRVNPITGGYFLSPNQYQEMMQQYVHGLARLAASNAPSNGGQMAPQIAEKDEMAGKVDF